MKRRCFSGKRFTAGPLIALAMMANVLICARAEDVGVLASVDGKQKLAKHEPPGDFIYHGVSVPELWNGNELRKQVLQFQQATGKELDLLTWFANVYEMGRLTSWRRNYAHNLDRIKRMGKMSLIKFSVQDYAFDQTKKIARTKEITLGTYDAYFKEFAGTVRDFKDPVFISINHEMNGTWYPYSEAYPGSNVTAADYVASWRRIVDIFRKAGANNVAWVWSPNVPDVGAVPASKYYPGDEYVDWIGTSFYSGNTMENFDPFYRTYAPRKPFFVTEWGTSAEKSRYHPAYPGDAKWIDQFFNALEKKYPRVKAISWFQWDREDGNHLLQRNLEQLEAYARHIQKARYGWSIMDGQ